jgi:hypothetical protein
MYKTFAILNLTLPWLNKGNAKWLIHLTFPLFNYFYFSANLEAATSTSLYAFSTTSFESNTFVPCTRTI